MSKTQIARWAGVLCLHDLLLQRLGYLTIPNRTLAQYTLLFYGSFISIPLWYRGGLLKGRVLWWNLRQWKELCRSALSPLGRNTCPSWQTHLLFQLFRGLHSTAQRYIVDSTHAALHSSTSRCFTCKHTLFIDTVSMIYSFYFVIMGE